MSKKPLIIFGKKSGLIETVAGVITREEWIKNEQERIGDHTKIVTDGDLIALFD